MKENDEKSAKIAIIHVACPQKFFFLFFYFVVGWLVVCFSFLLVFFFFFDDLTACERDERSARE